MTEDTSAQRDGFDAGELIELGELTIRSVREGAVHTVALTRELDLLTADEVDRQLVRAEATDAESIVLDLSGLTFMDSTGVRLVVNANARSRADAGRLTLRRGQAAVQRVMELSGVATLLPFED
ncbi:MAG TPA: STAS domain-containing protein [Solirubrobacteraceae bacterium]|nr:STAS domain-containing protein [Solirubrobacteraceae bacterium]